MLDKSKMFNESCYIIGVKQVNDYCGHPLPEIDKHYEYFAIDANGYVHFTHFAAADIFYCIEDALDAFFEHKSYILERSSAKMYDWDTLVVRRVSFVNEFFIDI